MGSLLPDQARHFFGAALHISMNLGTPLSYSFLVKDIFIKSRARFLLIKKLCQGAGDDHHQSNICSMIYPGCGAMG